MKVNKILYTILQADAAVLAQVSTRVYPLLAPQGVATPFIICGQTSNSPQDDKTGPATTDISIAEIFVFHQNIDTVEDIAELVRVALDRYSGTIAGIEVISIKYNNEFPDFDTDTAWYFKRLEFQIIAKR